jgi:glutathione S-transferase
MGEVPQSTGAGSDKRKSMSTIRVTAFKWVPPFAQGLVRDLRVRWALEEAGLPYEERLIGPDDQKSPDYRAQQPFGQVPVLEEDDLTLFESGSILLHVAERSPALLPRDPKGRARARTWLFAALNTLEPQIQQLAAIDLFFSEENWAKERRPGVVEVIDKRLGELSRALGDRQWLEGEFTVGDLTTATVLRILRHTDLVAKHHNLAAFLRRAEARPAFVKALADQMAPFAQYAPPS